MDGFTQDELMQIGQRKSKLVDLPMSASDINAPIPYAVSQDVMGKLEGFTESQLKDIGDRRVSGLPTLRNVNEINTPRVESTSILEDSLNALNRFLNIKLS